jgi:hypothetical protein
MPVTKISFFSTLNNTGVSKKTANSIEVIIAKNAYDALGQLAKKELGQKRNSSSQNTYTNSPIDTLRYTYNVRGWLRGINPPSLRCVRNK